MTNAFGTKGRSKAVLRASSAQMVGMVACAVEYQAGVCLWVPRDGVVAWRCVAAGDWEQQAERARYVSFLSTAATGQCVTAT